MNVAGVETQIRRFVRRHGDTLTTLSGRQSQLLELAAIVGVAEHYRAAGFAIETVNPRGHTFVVKTGTRGHPSAYSRICCSRGDHNVELHMNAMVRSGHDDGIYCVDVGIAEAECMPDTQKKGAPKWVCLPNKSLISFVEAKRLVVYPMLLAQFIGIVHEITPRFLESPRPLPFGPTAHLPPTLISLGHFSGNSVEIVRSFERRGYTVLIAENYDIRLAVSRKADKSKSPFYSEEAAEASSPSDGSAVLV